MPELIDLYDADMRPTGRTIVRGSAVPSGCYQMVVSVMTVNSEGKILMTKRAPTKKRGGQWEITTGMKQAGETPEQGICRELFEETGIAVQPEVLIRCGTDRGPHVFYLHYLVYAEEPETGIRLQKGETVDSRWVTAAELLSEADRIDPSGRERTLYLRFYGRVLLPKEGNT